MSKRAKMARRDERVRQDTTGIAREPSEVPRGIVGSPRPAGAEAPVGPAAVAVLCFIAVALLSPVNLTLLALGHSLLEKVFGGYFADNSGPLLYALGAFAQTGLFALLWLPLHLATRRRSDLARVVATVALTAAYLGAWLGWTAWLAAEMTRTNSWP